jgi:hypothetical protein
MLNCNVYVALNIRGSSVGIMIKLGSGYPRIRELIIATEMNLNFATNRPYRFWDQGLSVEDKTAGA